VAADLSDLLVAELEQIASLEADLAVDDPSRWVGDQPQHRHRSDRLAAARLADDGDRLALVDIVGDAVDRLDGSLAGEELRSQVLDFEELRHAHALYL
jgi:hypothetical protein